ncbi:MAG: 16S rRNA (adenine(1518)-N(6)/adenine(1519)-N(6))-dimethyltransferase RsmA [Candidatus Sungiibacteriota bacterium]
MEKNIPAKKSLGQHFLRCAWVSNTLIAAVKLTKKDTVLEIGPGTGILTRPLAAAAKEVIAVEKDETLALSLKAAFKKEGIINAQIIAADILKILSHLSTAYHLQPTTFKVVANIPYYLTGRLIRLLLESPVKPSVIALTIQKEVAERMVAKPPHMNLLALGVQAFGTAKIVKIVPAECFSPPPKVDSAIIVISDISDDFFTKNTIRQDAFFSIARAGFHQKRKTLANSLASVTGSKEKALALIRAAGLKNTSRPEELSLAQWTALSHAITAIIEANPQ